MSVPVWLAVLSDQLQIEALVSHYLTNKLIRRRLLLRHPFLRRGFNNCLDVEPLHYAVLA